MESQSSKCTVLFVQVDIPYVVPWPCSVTRKRRPGKPLCNTKTIGEAEKTIGGTEKLQLLRKKSFFFRYCFMETAQPFKNQRIEPGKPGAGSGEQSAAIKKSADFMKKCL